jgi:hypothetical protein
MALRTGIQETLLRNVIAGLKAIIMKIAREFLQERFMDEKMVVTGM